MEENMKQYNDVIKKIEQIFSNQSITYEKQDFEDEDLNYTITFPAYGRLKVLNSISGIMYFDEKQCMTLLIPNVYTVKENDNIAKLLEILNEMNMSLKQGAFFIMDNKLFYRNETYCGEKYAALNDIMIKMQIDIFTQGMEELIYALLDNEKDE